MYCVKCGVRLREGVESCPLCQTPVWNPDRLAGEPAFPDNYPHEHKESTLPAAVALTVICAAAMIAVLTVCFKLYGRLDWGAYALGGIGLFFVVFALPLWFRSPRAEVFIPVDHVAAALLALIICLKTGGKWFLSFAFPVALGSCVISTAVCCLLKFVRGGRLFVLGGALLAIGGFSILIEFFAHLSFGAEMFLWSLYSLLGFGIPGLFLVIAGIIPALRRGLKKRFFF